MIPCTKPTKFKVKRKCLLKISHHQWSSNWWCVGRHLHYAQHKAHCLDWLTVFEEVNSQNFPNMISYLSEWDGSVFQTCKYNLKTELSKAYLPVLFIECVFVCIYLSIIYYYSINHQCDILNYLMFYLFINWSCFYFQIPHSCIICFITFYWM